MGTLKIQMGGYVRERILSNKDIFSPVTGETLKIDLEGKPVNLKTGDLESKIEISPDAQGRSAVFIYPLDNDPEGSNGRLYAEDRFIFDPEGKTLIDIKRTFRMASGSEGLAFWKDLHARLEAKEKASPIRKEDPKVQKFFADVVLSLPEPTEGDLAEPSVPPSPAPSASSPPPFLLETVRPAPSKPPPPSQTGFPDLKLSDPEKVLAADSLLKRSKSLSWNETAKAVDQAVGRFLDGLSDPVVLGSLLAGSGAFRAGEAVMLSRLGSFRAAHPVISRLLGGVSGLALEVPAFELTGRRLHSAEGFNPWRWSGSHGLGMGLLRSSLTFGAFRGSGGLMRPALTRMAESGFLPFGRATVPTFSHLGSFATLHGVNELERTIKIRESEGGWPLRLFADGAFYAQMIFAGGMVETILGAKAPSAFEFRTKPIVEAAAEATPVAPAAAPEPVAPPAPAEPSPLVKPAQPAPPPRAAPRPGPFDPAQVLSELRDGNLDPAVLNNLYNSMPLVSRPANEHQGPFAMITTQGFGRTHNEDLILHVGLPTREYFYIGVDGMGGHDAGEIAARLAGEAFAAEIPRSNDLGRAWELANRAVHHYNIVFRQNGYNDREAAIESARQVISNPDLTFSLPELNLHSPAGAVATMLKVSSLEDASGGHRMEFQWIGDVRGTVLRRGQDGSWHWIYRTLDENLAYYPNTPQAPNPYSLVPGQHYAMGGEGRTLAAMRHPGSAVVIRALGMKATTGFKTTSAGEIPDPNHPVGAREAQGFENGILLEKGDLVLVASDGFWENFGRTRYILNLLQHVRTPEDAVKILTLISHQKMALYEQATQFFDANKSEQYYPFQIDNLPAWIDRDGAVYNERREIVDHYKMDNFSLLAYLHEPVDPLRPPPGSPEPPQASAVSPGQPATPQAAPPPPPTPASEGDMTLRLLKPGNFFALSDPNQPQAPRRAEEALNLAGVGEVSAFSHEGLVPFLHSRFEESPVNPDAFGFALNSERRFYFMTAEGIGPAREETGALAVRGTMEGLSKEVFPSPEVALDRVHALVSQKTGGMWRGGLVAVDREGTLQGFLEGGQKVWILRGDDSARLESLEARENRETLLNSGDTVILLSERAGRLLDERALAQVLDGQKSAEEMRRSLEEKAESRQKMLRDFGHALNLEKEQDLGSITALVYQYRPLEENLAAEGTDVKVSRTLPAILLPPVPATRAVLNPSEAPQIKIFGSGIESLGTAPNLPFKPRQSEDTGMISSFGEISAMTHVGIDKHVLLGQRSHTMNEDAYGIFLDAKGRPVMMVADGMGGYERGDVASALAIEGAAAVLKNEEATLGDAFILAHRRVQADNARRLVEWDQAGRTASQPELAKTVASAARVNFDGTVEVALVGDARIWVLRPAGSGEYHVYETYPPDTIPGDLLAGGSLKSLLEMHTHPESNGVVGGLGDTREPRIVHELGYRKFWERHPQEYQVLNTRLTLPKAGQYGEREPFRLEKGDSLLLMSDGVAELFDPNLLAMTIRGQISAEGIRTAIERKVHELLTLYQDHAFGLKKNEYKELPDGTFIDALGHIYTSPHSPRQLLANVGPDNVVALVYTQREAPASESLSQPVFSTAQALAERRARPTPAANFALGPIPEQLIPMLSDFRENILPQLGNQKTEDGVCRGSYQLIHRGGAYSLVAEKDIVVPMDGETLGNLNFTFYSGEIPPGLNRFEFTVEEVYQGSVPSDIQEMFRRISERQRRR